jgi:hypothetical protein
VEAGSGGQVGPLGEAQELAMSQGYLVPNQDAYLRAKAEAARKARGLSGEERSPQTRANAPASFRTWTGINDTEVGPSDSTGAVGRTRYIEMVNSKFAIYSRTSDTPISQDSLNTLIGEASGDVFDPQVIWDPSTNRFYYVMDLVFSATDNRLAFGFSKTATPSSAADFCPYELTFGSEFPDYPKLGDLGGTSGLLLIGTNTFNPLTDPETYLGSDLYSVTKPLSGTSCPAASTFKVDQQLNVKTAGGNTAFTPVPANQTDNSGTGYVVARPRSLPASFLTIYKVIKNSTGGLTVTDTDNRTVTSYDVPANAPQPPLSSGATAQRLDTLDARITQAVSAFDPRLGRTGLWTQHTVFGGGGAKVRWYEIGPVPSSPLLLQTGVVSFSSTFAFNGAISPDRRVVSGSTSKFGDSMIMGFNTSSATSRPAVRMVSKIGANAQSSSVLIRGSSVSLDDFTCRDDDGFPTTCRWGDYAAATPDPASSSTGVHGQVWLTDQFVSSQGSSSSSGWGSHNWATRP